MSPLGKSWRVSTDAWPFVLLRFGNPMSDEDYVGMFAALDEVMAREQRYVFFVDCRDVVLATAKQRKIITDFIARSGQAARRLCPASAVLQKSSIGQGFFNALTWVRPFASPVRLFTKSDEAVTWLWQTAQGTDLKIPPHYNPAMLAGFLSPKD